MALDPRYEPKKLASGSAAVQQGYKASEIEALGDQTEQEQAIFWRYLKGCFHLRRTEIPYDQPELRLEEGKLAESQKRLVVLVDQHKALLDETARVDEKKAERVEHVEEEKTEKEIQSLQTCSQLKARIVSSTAVLKELEEAHARLTGTAKQEIISALGRKIKDKERYLQECTERYKRIVGVTTVITSPCSRRISTASILTDAASLIDAEATAWEQLVALEDNLLHRQLEINIPRKMRMLEEFQKACIKYWDMTPMKAAQKHERISSLQALVKQGVEQMRKHDKEHGILWKAAYRATVAANWATSDNYKIPTTWDGVVSMSTTTAAASSPAPAPVVVHKTPSDTTVEKTARIVAKPKPALSVVVEISTAQIRVTELPKPCKIPSRAFEQRQ
jgi:hypothetical protein